MDEDSRQLATRDPESIIKYANERGKKNRARKGEKTRDLYAQGFGEKTPLTCDLCLKRVKTVAYQRNDSIIYAICNECKSKQSKGL